MKERFHNERTERKFWKFFWTIAVVVSSFGRMFRMGRLVIYGLFFLVVVVVVWSKVARRPYKTRRWWWLPTLFFFSLELFILFSIKTVCVVQSWGVESAWAAAAVRKKKSRSLPGYLWLFFFFFKCVALERERGCPRPRFMEMTFFHFTPADVFFLF